METNAINQKKPDIKKLGICLALILIALVFISNTAYSFNQPIVTATLPKNGKLNKSEKATGIAGWSDIKEIYAELSGTIGEILVEEGDFVTAGQPLLYMEYDRESLEQKLKEVDISKRKALLSIESSNIKIERAKDNIKSLEEDIYKPDSVSDYEINEVRRQIERLEQSLSDKTTLFEIGAAPKTEVDQIAYELETAQKKLENLQKLYDDNVSKSADSLSDKEKSREKQISSYNQEIKELNQQIKSLNLDYENLLLQESLYMSQLEKFADNEVIIAPADGKIESLNVKSGAYINERTLIASLGLGNEYTIECTVPADNNFIFIEDSCLIYNSAHRFEAIVTKITAAENGKKIQLTVSSDDIEPGETFDIDFKRTSDMSYTLVPNGAINMDTDGYFIYRLSRRDGIMGKEYYASKIRVEIGDKDSENTAVIKGIDFFEPIVLLSDKPFEEKDTIKIKNESDFFDN